MYVAVKGGEAAIDNAHRLLAHSLDFEDHPFAVQRFAEPCALCAATGVYLDEVVLDDRGGRMFVCSDRGDVVDVARADPRRILALRRTAMGYVSQFLRVIPRVSTLDVVTGPLVAEGGSPDAARVVARDLLARLNLPERLWSLPSATFSGGEQARVNIARGFAPARPILLLDEPTASLDDANRAVVADLVAEKKRGGGRGDPRDLPRRDRARPRGGPGRRRARVRRDARPIRRKGTRHEPGCRPGERNAGVARPRGRARLDDGVGRAHRRDRRRRAASGRARLRREKRGIAPGLIEAEIRGLELAIRAALWR